MQSDFDPVYYLATNPDLPRHSISWPEEAREHYCTYGKKEGRPGKPPSPYWPFSSARQFKLALCGIFKNEADLLAEWLEHWVLMGVEHFVLYDNGSDDGSTELLAPYIADGLVTLIKWQVPYAGAGKWQISAYEHASMMLRNRTEWMGFIDSDEFLRLPEHTSTMPAFLSRFEAPLSDGREIGALALNWKLMDNDGCKNLEDRWIKGKGLTTAALTRGDRAGDPLIKSFVRMKHWVPRWRHPHNPAIAQGTVFVNVDREPFTPQLGKHATGVHKEAASLLHFWIRDEEYVEKMRLAKIRGRDGETRANNWAERLRMEMDERIIPKERILDVKAMAPRIREAILSRFANVNPSSLGEVTRKQLFALKVASA